MVEVEKRGIDGGVGERWRRRWRREAEVEERGGGRDHTYNTFNGIGSYIKSMVDGNGDECVDG